MKQPNPTDFAALATRFVARSLASPLVLLVLACEQATQVDEQDASDRVASAYCEQVFDCRCIDSAGFSSVEACRATLVEALRDEQGEAVSNSLVYDAACVGSAIDRIDEVGCSRDSAVTETCNDCFAYHGHLPDRSPCERIGPFSTCDQGLKCTTIVDYDGNAQDVCVPACKRPGEGEGCAYAGDNYQVVFACEEGLWCDTEVVGACMELPGPGSPCHEGVGCGRDAWCDASVETPVCAASKAVADGCNADIECASTWCRDGLRCDRPFAENAPCVAGTDRCDAGLYCPENYPFCTKTDALVCAAPLPGF